MWLSDGVWKKAQEIRIEIDEDLKFSLNKVWWGCHFSVRSRFRNNWHDEIENKSSHIDKIEWICKLEFRFFFKTRYLDSSNCSAMAKMIEDGLVEHWVIKWDTNLHVQSVYLESVLLEPKAKKNLKSDYVIISIIPI